MYIEDCLYLAVYLQAYSFKLSKQIGCQRNEDCKISIRKVKQLQIQELGRASRFLHGEELKFTLLQSNTQQRLRRMQAALLDGQKAFRAAASFQMLWGKETRYMNCIQVHILKNS